MANDSSAVGKLIRGNRNGTNASAPASIDSSNAISGNGSTASATPSSRKEMVAKDSTEKMGIVLNDEGSAKNAAVSGDHMAAILTTLQNASGTEFNSLFLSQMLSMHEAKLAELQKAAISLTDSELKLNATKAIPTIKMHRDMLLRLSKGDASAAESH